MSDTQTLYKVLVNGKSCHGGEAVWSLPNGKPGDWMRYEGELAICKSGIHLTKQFEKWLKVGCAIYEAEAEGIKEWDEDKCVCRAARLLKQIDTPDWWIGVEKFIREEIDTCPWFKKSGELTVAHKLFTTRVAAWDATGVAAGDAARVVILDAARDAAWAAARDATWDATWNAAWAAARDAAWDAAWGAAWGAAWDATWAAALQCVMTTVCAELDIAPEYRQYAADAWSIWRAGYGCLGKVGNEFIVYERGA